MKEYRDAILHSLAIVVAAFARNEWELSRNHFHVTCKRADISAVTAQAILEVDYGMDVDRQGHKKQASDRMHLSKSAEDLIGVDRVLRGAA